MIIAYNLKTMAVFFPSVQFDIFIIKGLHVEGASVRYGNLTLLLFTNVTDDSDIFNLS